MRRKHKAIRLNLGEFVKHLDLQIKFIFEVKLGLRKIWYKAHCAK